jgi:hypothetical protein
MPTYELIDWDSHNGNSQSVKQVTLAWLANNGYLTEEQTEDLTESMHVLCVKRKWLRGDKCKDPDSIIYFATGEPKSTDKEAP